MSLHRKQNSGNSTGPIAYGVKVFSCNHKLYSIEEVVAMVTANEKVFPN